MKIAYQHLVNFIPSNPSKNELSEKLFQLGHEHEIDREIFNMELTPNRGDCLSLNGLLRDLAVFYEIEFDKIEIYKNDIDDLDIDFINKAPAACPYISFLKIEIEGPNEPYKELLKDYFEDLDINKNNFFTDISNYISYELGQPTHCYDYKKIKNKLSLEVINKSQSFETLLGQKIELTDKNLVFLNEAKVINLAGIMGNKNTACSNETECVLIECAYFNPEEIVGKSIKYDIKSEAAHKFERNVDPCGQEKVLRRFIKIVNDHAKIKSLSIYSLNADEFISNKINFDYKKINNILGTQFNSKEIESHLHKLGFKIKDNKIIVPSFRSDIKNNNDIAEEIARAHGYNNIDKKVFKIPNLKTTQTKSNISQNYISSFLLKHGFYEVINNPFVNSSSDYSIKIDNPLDSNKQYLRTNLEKSLLDNLLYNERRQKDSIKLYEISDIYYKDDSVKDKKVLGIICSGRVDKNYLDFSKKINSEYLINIFKVHCPDLTINPKIISRDNLETKLKNEIVYLELELDKLSDADFEALSDTKKTYKDYKFVKYKPISEYPSSFRDLSFSVKDVKKYYILQDLILNIENELLKEVFVFDFYNNQKSNEIKIGFRFIFQSSVSTITENEIKHIMDGIIKLSLKIDSVTIPGLN